ncbi:CFI-box-CTERM domain-containing protein [Gemmiger sp.]
MKKEQGLIHKCPQCGQWHYVGEPCPQREHPEFRYECRKSLITANEQQFFKALRELVPQGYHVFPQINLATFIERTDNAVYRNELFRNVDFLVTDAVFAPKIVVEINDPSHRDPDRRRRDEKVAMICEEAGVPLVTLWTNYGVNREYIQKRITQALEVPPPRVAHFKETAVGPTENAMPHQSWDEQAAQYNNTRGKKQGCYVATCVYGSYDCPQVWVLRRYRDEVLKKSALGRCFVATYYAISPTLVRVFGKNANVRTVWRGMLDHIVRRLQGKGFSDKPYSDL